MSTNVSKQNRDDLLGKIGQIRTFISIAPQDENTGNLLSYLTELEKDVQGKKYGLVFEEHREGIDALLATHSPVLTEEKDLFINNDEQPNFLIEGDNLASLKVLEKTHKEKIDLIYIDPPYNTNNKDFVYDDTFIDSTDGFRHSKWLSFMNQRLRSAKILLKNSGVIFISIDDNEVAQLRMLCDEVFGENNFVGMILWKKKTNGNNMGWLPPVHDYIICFSKSIDNIFDLGFEISEEDILKNYSNPDNDPRGPWKTSDLSANHKGPHFPITNPTTGDTYYPPEGRYWVFNEQEVLKRIKDGRIIFGKSGKARPVQRVFIKDRVFSKRKAESWWDNHGLNADATQELKEAFGMSKVFTHPKPTKLIQNIVNISCPKDGIILDFFAGSGTTGHAVMNLNAMDGGRRRFVLCTNNENNICRDITYERLKRVIEKNKYTASLKYYKVDYIPISERLYYEYADELLRHIRELVELENGVNFTNNAEIGIVLTEEELNAYTASTDNLSKCRKLYMGHDLLPTSEQEGLFKERNIEISIIPDYYYRDLQER
ncbi:site-specific DNA-methyltransferase [Paenibacillus sp. GCM10027626]|uniref:site-specific DNA-methyltransferase n=1 Tax=Paenibacillus sp. GCM10027626 TaxID=3273411 RepID=UPI00363B9F76